ncbi:MAG TPA: hypothetical protein EYG03_03895 [Planctomycetes bacterium]|nr:hypothetical protein [Fuerstiella sp.]HIK91121.1 hypothetical protein [Planctomycetota bacterium]
MPAKNQFRHQSYPTAPSVRPAFHRLRVTDGDDVDFSKLHSQFGVREVVLVHGTFMGDDPFGISEVLRTIAKSAGLLEGPLMTLADVLQARMKSLVDGLAQDVGNYTLKYCDAFQQLVGGDPMVRLLQPTWTGQNHHLARADLAVRLLWQLDDMQPTPEETVLLWGHSHAGNAFAILSNLLANDRNAVAKFFTAAGHQDAEHWARARQILESGPSPHPWAKSVLFVAFGTPVRYGWDSNGYRDLLHVLHHRQNDNGDEFLAQPMFPAQSLNDMLTARYGDWVQAFGIAGTDVPPPIAMQANRAVAAVLEAGLTAPEHGLDTRFIVPQQLRDTCARWKTGTRCHGDGRNLLVEYEPSGRTTPLASPIEETLLGHGVATTLAWLPAHLALVLQALSSSGTPAVAR